MRSAASQEEQMQFHPWSSQRQLRGERERARERAIVTTSNELKSQLTLIDQLTQLLEIN